MKKGSIQFFKHEYDFIRKGYDFVIGVDEAGRGPLAGPVVVAAVALRKNCHSRESGNPDWIPGQARNDKKFGLVRDSKLLSEKQREELYDFIHEHFHVGIGICDHRIIDRINILQTTYLAMKKAITALSRNIYKSSSPLGRGCPEGAGEGKGKDFSLIRTTATFSRREKGNCGNVSCIILVDGNKIIPNCSYNQKAIIGGDKIVKSISAASIIAKVTRDRIMREYHKKYPAYNFARHKGYGTKMHRDMIKKHGPCKIHRRSFRLM
jgi:ribonuclease HII